jgi:hypothetical protein
MVYGIAQCLIILDAENIKKVHDKLKGRSSAPLFRSWERAYGQAFLVLIFDSFL